MRTHNNGRLGDLYQSLGSFLRLCVFRVLSMGPIPSHLAFIMDGNRRFAKKKNLKEGAGHRAGFSSLISMLKYCYELGVKYVTVYAFSIDNFKRRADEVKDMMELMLEKMEELLKEESIVNQYGIRVYFIGNLKLLGEPVRITAEKVMKATANNTKCTLLICIAYTSRDEIVHAVQESCMNKSDEIQPLSLCKANDFCAEEPDDDKKINGVIRYCFREPQKDDADESQATGEVEGGGDANSVVEAPVQSSYEDEVLMANGTSKCVTSSEESEKTQEKCSISIVKLVDIEKHMYMAVAPEPDILIRSSGETRLSNFLLWQATNCQLYSPQALWPEIGLWHLVWAVVNFQHNYSYLEKKRKRF